MKNFTKPSKKTICVCNRDVSTEEKRWILSVSRTGFIQAKCSLTEQSSRVNKSKFRDRSLQESKSANKPEHNFFIFSNISSILFETSAQATLVWSKICKKMHFTAYSYITVRSNAAHHCRASGNSSNGSSIAPTFPPLLSQSSLYSKQLEASGKVMSVYVGFCVCVSWGKVLDLIGTGMSNVSVNQAGTPVRQNSPVPNKRSSAWMRISLPTPEWL